VSNWDAKSQAASSASSALAVTDEESMVANQGFLSDDEDDEVEKASSRKKGEVRGREPLPVSHYFYCRCYYHSIVTSSPQSRSRHRRLHCSAPRKMLEEGRVTSGH
jgi:hypothetical protein